MHGGISPELLSLRQIRDIRRPTDIPDRGLLCDLLWSDPDKVIKGWGSNDRGVSYTFGSDTVSVFLKRLDLDLICRAHQVCVLLFLGLKATFWCLFPFDASNGFGLRLLKMGLSSLRISS